MVGWLATWAGGALRLLLRPALLLGVVAILGGLSWNGVRIAALGDRDSTTPTATARIPPSPGATEPAATGTPLPASSGTASPGATDVAGDGSPAPAATVAATATATITVSATVTRSPTAPPIGTWRIRSVDTMKLSRDTLRAQLSDRQIAAIVRLDAQLHLTHVTVDVYYDDPLYMARWVRAIRAAGLHAWFRPHWYSWEDHRERHGTMSPQEYIEATRSFLQQHASLLENGDLLDFCPEPENGAYWLHQYGAGWSWRNRDAKAEFNTFIRSGVYMASTTLANRGRGGVLVTAISVDHSIATRMFSKPTVRRLGMITLDLYPEGTTRDPATAARRLVAEIEGVHRRWNLPVLVGEHGYARDVLVDDPTQARVLAAELAALAHLPYLVGLNYWVDAGGPGFGGYTNLYRLSRGIWQPRPAATVLARAFAAMSPRPGP